MQTWLVAPIRDDDKALSNPEEQRKVDLKVHFNQNMAIKLQTHLLKPSQQDANVIFYPLLYFFALKEFPYVKVSLRYSEGGSFYSV